MTVSITVRVRPRSGRAAIEASPDGAPLIRVRAVPAGGEATAEAAAALAVSLGVPRTSVRLRTGARSRVKVFDVDGVSPEALASWRERL